MSPGLINRKAQLRMQFTNTDDIKKMALNDIFGKGDRFGLDEKSADVLAEGFAEAIARKAPQFVGSMIPKMKSDPLDKLEYFYRRVLKLMEKEARTNEERAVIEKKKSAFDKAMNFNLSFVESGESREGEEKEEGKPGPTVTPSSGGTAKT